MSPVPAAFPSRLLPGPISPVHPPMVLRLPVPPKQPWAAGPELRQQWGSLAVRSVWKAQERPPAVPVLPMQQRWRALPAPGVPVLLERPRFPAAQAERLRWRSAAPLPVAVPKPEAAQSLALPVDAMRSLELVVVA